MANPYTVLGVPADATDEQIRKRYLELIRQFPPEHHAEQFSRVRAAYEKIKDLDARVRHRLYEANTEDTIDAIIEDLACQTPRRRFTLQQLLTDAAPATPR